MVQKIYSKIHLVSFTNIHHGVTDFVNHGMVKNAKTWISWEWNITFLRNKKVLNLCPRWQILRSYRFVAEVTFNDLFHVNIRILPIMLCQFCQLKALTCELRICPKKALIFTLQLWGVTIFFHMLVFPNLFPNFLEIFQAATSTNSVL